MKGYASAPGGASSVTRSSVRSPPSSESEMNSHLFFFFFFLKERVSEEEFFLMFFAETPPPPNNKKKTTHRVAMPTCSNPPRTAPARRFWYRRPRSSLGSSTQSVSGLSSSSSDTEVPAASQPATRGVTPRNARNAPRATASMAARKPAQAEAGARDLERKSSTRRQPML